MNSHSKIISLQSAKGGVGCSVIAGNLAIGLAARNHDNVCLIELDAIRGGCQAGLFNIDPEIAKNKNIKKIIDSGKINKDVFLANIINHKTGVSLLSAETAEELDSISYSQIAQIIYTAGTIYEYVVIDLAQPYVSEEMLAAFDFSGTVCLVMTPDIITFEHTQKFLEVMKSLNYPAAKFQLLLNMSGISSTEIDIKNIQSYMSKNIYGIVPFDVEKVLTSVNTGVPILQSFYQGQNNQGSSGLSSLIKFPNNNVQSEISNAFQEISLKLAQINPVNLENALNYANKNFQKNIDSNPEPKNSLKAENKPKNEENKLYGVDKEIYRNIKLITHKKLVSELRLDKITTIDLNDSEKKSALKEQIIDRIGKIFDEQGFAIEGRGERANLIRDIANEALGMGPLEDLLADEDVTEIMVNGAEKIYVERAGKLTMLNRTFTDDKQLRVVIDRIVAPIGRRVDESSPYVDARLKDGSRVNIIIPPLAIDGSSITIRKFPSRRLTIADLINRNSVDQDMADFLEKCVKAKLNIFISGGTGSGKTTLLNILSSFIPDDERIVTIEDAAELSLHQDHVVRLESRPANIEGKGEVSTRALVKNSLRMRPDRIVVGEVRGGEALDMLQVMNTGHDGSLATGHANSPRDALSRIETMVLMAGMDLPVRAIREQIASAINLVVQQSRLRDGSRRVTKIVEITGMEGEVISTQDIFTFEQKGIDENGMVLGSFRPTSIRPKIIDSFEVKGISIPDVFKPENIIAKMRNR